MRWPFVWRSTLEAAIRDAALLRADVINANAHAQFSQALHAGLVESHRDLLDKYHALRATGAAIPTPTQRLVSELAAKEIDPVLRLIHDVTAGKPRGLRSIMLAQVAKDRAGGMADEVIMERIEQGIESDGVPA